jgi:TRAP-type C4-dicarboxylate transport system permease small subunit
MLDTLIRRYCRLLAGLMVLCLAAMVVMVFGNVVLRYAFNTGITLSEELSRWLFVWMTFLGAVVALAERAHLGTEALLVALPVAARRFCLGLSLLLMLFICYLVFKGAWEQTRINWDTTSAVMEVSMAWFYASGMVFAVLGAPILLLHLWRLVTGRLPDAELVGVRESEDTP